MSDDAFIYAPRSGRLGLHGQGLSISKGLSENCSDLHHTKIDMMTDRILPKIQAKQCSKYSGYRPRWSFKYLIDTFLQVAWSYLKVRGHMLYSP